MNENGIIIFYDENSKIKVKGYIGYVAPFVGMIVKSYLKYYFHTRGGINVLLENLGLSFAYKMNEFRISCINTLLC